MDWQQAISLALVIITAALFVRGAVRKRMHPPSSSDCGGGCANCSAARPAEINEYK